MSGITEGDPRPKEKLAPGRLDVVENLDREDGEPDAWLRVFLLPEEGDQVRQALFTKDEVLTAIARVPNNREDLNAPKSPDGVIANLRGAIDQMFERLQR